MALKEIVKKHAAGLAAKGHKHEHGKHKKGELHHIEVHPAKNGFTVEHHTHKGMDKDGFEPYNTDKEETVFENHHKAAKHVKGIMEEHASMQDGLEAHQSGKPIGKSTKHSEKEDEVEENGY